MSAVWIGESCVLTSGTLSDRIWSFDELERAEAELGGYGMLRLNRSMLVLYGSGGQRYPISDYCSPLKEVSDNNAASVASVINSRLAQHREAIRGT